MRRKSLWFYLICYSCILFCLLFFIAPQRKLIWSDEFNGNAVYVSKWNYETNYRHDAWNVERAVRVGEGNLIIKAINEGGNYYSGIINTKNKFSLDRGYLEVRVCFGAKRRGIWSAVWLYDDSNLLLQNEIDLLEHRSFDINNKDIHSYITSALHLNGYFENAKSLGTDSGPRNLDIGYHIYGLEFTKTGYNYFIDNSLYWTVTLDQPPPGPFYIILSVEMKDLFPDWVGPLDKEDYNDEIIYIDYVRAYDKK